MKPIVLACCLLFSYGNTFAQETPQNYSDSLTLAKEMIDKLDMTMLVKQHEHFLYLSRKESYKLYKEIYLYIEERIKIVSK